MSQISIEWKNLSVFLLVIVLLATGVVIYQFFVPKSITTYDYYGIPMKFRMDLKQAGNIPVYPDDLEIYNIIWNENNENITIQFVNSSDNSLLVVEAFEITFKLKLVFNLLNFNINITAKETDSYNISTDENHPVIALIPPSLANKTVVEVKNNVIFIEGKTKDEFDLATIKFLMSALDMKVG